MAAPTCALTIINRFPYRGANEDYSNHYMLTGVTPADATAWRTLFDALVAQHKTVLLNSETVVGGYGYSSVAAGATAVWSVDLTVAPNTPVAGTLTGSGGVALSGDTALWIRWKLNRLNTKGKPVYLRKYYHPGVSQTAPNQDLPLASWTTAAAALGGKLRDGTFLDGRTITDHLGSSVLGSGTATYITTRTLKRRGKRPPT